MAFADLVPDQEEFDGLGHMDPSPAFGGFLHLGRERAEFLDFLGKVVEGLDNRIQCGDLLLGVAGFAELSDQPLLRVLGVFLKDDGITLLGGDLKVTVRLEFFLRGIKPLFERCRVKDRGNECGCNFIDRGLAAVVGKDGADESHGILGGLCLHRGGIGCRAGEDVF